MRITIIILFILSIKATFSQQYLPFRPDNPTRFEDGETPANDHYFYSVLETSSGDTTTIFQYAEKSSSLLMNPNYCYSMPFTIAGDTTWLGTKFRLIATSNKLTLYNKNADTLDFNFGISMNDSAIFYTNNNDIYYIKLTSISNESVLDSIDSVKTFTVSKFDINGNPVVSNFNNYQIKLSANYGLITFIDCYNFPEQENAVTLKGFINADQTANGYYQLTNEELYPWYPNDTLVYIGHHFATTSTTSYKFYYVVDRVESSDSVWIYFNSDEQISSTYYMDTIPYPAPYNISYPNIFSFKKKKVPIVYPYNSAVSDLTITTELENICGEDRSKITLARDGTHFCINDFAFIYGDASTEVNTSHTSIEGLGATSGDVGPGPYNVNFINEKSFHLVYSNINGVQCGTPMTLSTIELSMDSTKELIKITDLLGREVDEFTDETVLIYIYSDGSIEKKFNVD